MTKTRQDAWTEENDLLLAETVLRHVREGSTQLNAFEEVGDALNRTSAACGFRWNAVVRHEYEKALELAKKQRKQRNRLLGKEQSGKKKLLYQPPTVDPSLLDMNQAPAWASILTDEQEEEMVRNAASSYQSEEVVEEETPEVTTSTIPSYEKEELAEEVTPVASSFTQRLAGTSSQDQVSLSSVISYLSKLDRSSDQSSVLKSENERLNQQLHLVLQENEQLKKHVAKLERTTVTMQEDYETLMKIMNRARKLVLFEEEEETNHSKFKMDRNGNLEKVAEG
ncbi:RsfA family transcriptional regulator [Mangrovibacillus cuniculi]|uniref:RsfA family transcriptional regulator n=1 Tax=Mangrovibacillus cuniculi TaxID=2593652 RepID=A0A7S8HHA0_9BACI|nr:RsfA family transcriptional regulator [Mangrovibacillus cuniculi]QPC48456.1 RsfA family transcriptional regulator [Mangrovibacillus cuniculi]